MQQTAEQAFQEQRAAALARAEFPSNMVHPDFKMWLDKCLLSNSFANMSIPLGTYEAFVRFDRPLMMPEMMLALRMLASATPNELKVTTVEYLDILQDVYRPMQQNWSEIDDKVCDPIRNKIQAQVRVTQAVPEAKRLYKLGQA